VNYDYGGESFVNDLLHDDSANGIQPIAAVSEVFGPVRVTVRYENTASTPNEDRASVVS
jgi:hypothetical protein